MNLNLVIFRFLFCCLFSCFLHNTTQTNKTKNKTKSNPSTKHEETQYTTNTMTTNTTNNSSNNIINNNRMLMSPPPPRRRCHRKPLGIIIQKENADDDDDGDDSKKTEFIKKKKTLLLHVKSPEPKNNNAVPSPSTTPEMTLPIITTPMKTPVALNYNRNNSRTSTPNTITSDGGGGDGDGDGDGSGSSKIGLFRTPNAGKILSPLPLQSRRLKTPAQNKKIVTIDNMDEYFHLLHRVDNSNIDDDDDKKKNDNDNEDNRQYPSSTKEKVEYYQKLKSKHHLALMMNESDDDARDDDGDDEDYSIDNNNKIGGSINNIEVKPNIDKDDADKDDDEDDDDSIEWERSIDDVEFVCKLGEGGTAQVYQVREKDTGTMFALKVQKESDDAMCEMDLHIPLLHPHICRMIDYFYCDTKPFEEHILMDVQSEVQYQQQQLAEEEDDESCSSTRYLCTILELCTGGSLHDVIDRFVTMPESIAAQYMKDAINALEYLHKDEMIIHCDIKPGNWLVTGEGPDTTVGIIKLADFGMAVPFNEREIVGGSPVYMSPEHLLAWRDMTDKIDYRADIYSMGVVLYEMLMGYLPYEVLEANANDDEDNDGTTADDLLSESESDISSVVKNNKGNGNDDAVESTAKNLIDLSIVESNDDQHDQDHDNDNEFGGDSGYPVLDLRKLNDITSDKPFYIPPPIFLEAISDEAQDLIMRLMEPSLSKRITLEEAKNHGWFQKVLLSSSSNDVHV